MQAVAYLRSSKDRSDVSIAAQRRALLELAASRNLSIVDEFADAVESGKDDDRPGFQSLLRALRSPRRQWQIVLALDTSRIARRRYLALFFERECERHQVQIMYRNVPDMDPVTGMLLKSILQAMDEWHSLVSKSKGIAGMQENVRAGFRAGGRAPRGYDAELVATGAVREGKPVTKTKLTPNGDAQAVRAYLEYRAAGIDRKRARQRAAVTWSISSLNSTDWQALTYAGHTTWNVHAERESGRSVTGTKRRPRSEWMIERNTHEALISDDQAEAILAQLEKAQTGRRQRQSPLLLAGLVQTEGRAWHSDGAGMYRLAKGKKISARRLERAILDRIQGDLASDDTVARIRRTMAELDAKPVPHQRLSGLERRITKAKETIAGLADLAARATDAEPYMNRIADHQGMVNTWSAELDELRAQQAYSESVQRIIPPEQIRSMLAALFTDLRDRALTGDIEQARAMLTELVDHIELDREARTARVHYATELPSESTGDNVASRRLRHITPVTWAGDLVPLAA